MKLLPQDQWELSIEGDALLIGAWEDNGVRHWERVARTRAGGNITPGDKGYTIHIGLGSDGTLKASVVANDDDS
ncbi:hypothetical protein PE067_08175 [Paracoccus sp. DMF-8]|uniref:hypothetical protein n=1 Tax=Paracoccus sp. DMF-8 TaxID=3019445 RepID=UPI0023E7767C|nr:hypothetical protein [Paracoccus sp. DMF-8]MDF3606104.1 hypothetical protein [Paracoccus sp. DMF-8]